MKNKGFTLIELLAVIVILAVIALIATPLIMGTISKAKMNSLKDSAYGILKAAENYQAEELMNQAGDTEPLIIKNLESENQLNYKGKKPKCGYLAVDSDIEKIVLSDGQYLVEKNDRKDTITVSKGTCQDVNDKREAEKPVQEGLQVYYDGTKAPVLENGKLIWKDQSSHGRNGEMINFNGKNYYQNKSIVFDGTDYIIIGEMNYEEVTLEAYINSAESPKTEAYQYHILSNTQLGGYCILNQRDKTLFTFYKSGVGYTYSEAGYRNQMDFPTVQYGKDYYYGATYDKNMAKFYVNLSKYQAQVGASIGKTNNQASMMVGANPINQTQADELYVGRIYSIRVYNRPLSEKEIRYNYMIDKLKYGV